MRCSRTCRRRLCAGIAAFGILVAPLGAGAALAAEPPAPGSYAAVGQGRPAVPGPYLAAAPAVQGDFPELTPAVAERLDKAIQDVMKEAGVPGVTVGLSAPGKGTYIRSFGVADKDTGQSMRPNLFMRIGSETKTFTVTALLELVDQGKVSIDDPISRYVDGVPNGDRITLRNLASMRSGLFNYSADEDFYKALTQNPDRPFTPRELLDFAFKHPVQFQPGAEFDYCNTNLILLGLVVEKVSGTPLHEFIQKNVLDPAGLDHTVFPTDATIPNPHAHGYTVQTASGQVEDATDWNPSWAWAAGAMISNLQDLRTWAGVVATGTLLTPKTQAERLKVYPTDIPGAGYGLGIFNIQGWIGHNGSLPGYESLTIYLPEPRATLVVLLNTDTLHDDNEPSTLFGQAITRIVTPDHVFDIPVTAAAPSSPSPSKN
ncbi:MULTISPECIES: serine hydrolase domain-containing protein [unclassified Streptomyces]|uniref:serine hydrolase domain-containing protein n=1 Tax=unclassified Streptomyces TaxID=2593676 RepID=UPI0030D2E5A7